MSEVMSSLRGVDKLRVDNCVFKAFEDLSKVCSDDGSTLKDTIYNCKKSVGSLNYIRGVWRIKKTSGRKDKKDSYIISNYLDIYAKIMNDIDRVCEYSRNENYKKALEVITLCRAKLKWSNYKVNNVMRKEFSYGILSSDTKKLSRFLQGEIVSYKLFDKSRGEIKEVISDIDSIFEKSILNRGWEDSGVDTKKNWELCACGGGGFFVKREYLKPFAPKLPSGTSIKVEECRACDHDAGVRGLREKRHSSKPERGQYPSYREHIKEIFGDGQFHPDML